MHVRNIVAIAGLAALLLPATSSTLLAQPAPIDRPAELREGTCVSPGELVTTLANLVVAIGDPQGQANAMPVEQSGTVVPYTVSALLEVDHIVTVQQSAEQTLTVACGEVGGTRNPDGTLAVGMLGMNGSGLSGIAYFTPNPGFDNTLITILLVTDDGAAGEPSASSELETGAEPAGSAALSEASGTTESDR